MRPPAPRHVWVTICPACGPIGAASSKDVARTTPRGIRSVSARAREADANEEPMGGSMTTNSDPRDLLTRARELAEAATAGPWDAVAATDWSPRTHVRRPNDQLVTITEHEDDARFIAEARTLLPALVDVVEEMRAALEEIEMNCQGVLDGKLAHFRRKDIADAAATRARSALSRLGTGKGET